MYIKKEDILNATHGGLDIILYYYPQAHRALETSRKEFSIREERTPSARLKQLQDGNWVVTDFGGDQVPRNGISVCMEEENISFREALVLLADRYNVGGIKADTCKPDYESRPATAQEEEGKYAWELNEKLSAEEMQVLGPLVNEEVCKAYHVFSIKSYTYTKNRTTHIKSATPYYPIFLIDNGEWQKIYEPQAYEKQYRFKYIGKKPKDLLNGLEQVRKIFAAWDTKQEQDLEAKIISEKKKLPEIIICSGETDSYNLAAWGYPVVWLNSETAKLSKEQYKLLMQYTEQIYVLPDIDETGVRAAVKLGLEYIDIKIIWLPEGLKKYKDKRGNPRKDFKDYAELYQSRKNFSTLLDIAMPMRFWDSFWEKDKNRMKYEFNPEYCFHFLYHSGFAKIESKNVKEGVELVQLKDNVVKVVRMKDINAHLDAFVRSRQLPIPLRNMMHRTKQLSEGQLLAKLPEIALDFSTYDKRSQYLFFENITWELTPEHFKEHRSANVSKCVWEENIIPHKVKKQEPPFKITNSGGEYDIEILNPSSCFFRVLINTSRIYWQEEMGENASPEEKKAYYQGHPFEINAASLSDKQRHEQRLHLINKIFSIGYLLHRYKDAARPWAIFAMDNRLSDIGESHGGSGKSVVYKSLRHFMKSVTLPGRNPKLTENPHIYDRVTEHTDYILVDDSDQYIKFGFFFDALTGELIVNPKNNQSYEIPFAHVPKYCFTSNFTLRNIDPSTERRLLYTVFSDWYHKASHENGYTDTRTIHDDFGKNIFDDYSETEWNDDFNFFAYCLHFYLSVPSPQKIEPPMGNVFLRNLRAVMGDQFWNWSEVYFSADGGHINTEVCRKSAFEDFAEETKLRRWTTNKFTKALKAYCQYHNYIYNPTELSDKHGRIIKKKDGAVTDYFYIKIGNQQVISNETVQYSGSDPF